MSNAYINVLSTLIGPALIAIGLIIGLFAGFLAPSGLWRGRYGVCSNGRGSLALHLSQNARRRLQRLGSRNGGWQRKRGYFDHDPVPIKNRYDLFTIFGQLLHRRNEGSVKHCVFKYILDKFELICLLSRFVCVRGFL
jgi:hypothetical protein